MKDSIVSFAQNTNLGSCCGIKQAGIVSEYSNADDVKRHYYLSDREFEVRREELCKTLRHRVLGLKFPTLFASAQTERGATPAQARYVKAIVEICEEENIPYVALPSHENANYPNSGRIIGGVIVYPKTTKFATSNLCYESSGPCENIVYSSVGKVAAGSM